MKNEINEMTTEVMENTANFMEEGGKEFGAGMLTGIGATVLSTYVIVPVIKKVITKVKNAWTSRKEKIVETEEKVVELVEAE